MLHPHRHGLALASFLLAPALAACDPAPAVTDGGPTPPRDAPGADAPRPAFSPDHTFPAIELTPPENEVQGICQSWTLNNPEPIYVHGVTFDAGPGWHHSNWVYVPERYYAGPDGTWRCSDREFSEVAAGAVGGGAFFAQSTQATHEEQTFPDGAAYVIPAYARVVGSVHVLNFTGAPVSTAASFHIDLLPEAEVTQVLRTMAIDNSGIEVLARSSSESMTECDFANAPGSPGLDDVAVYYVLPHYHSFASGFALEIFGGPNDGQVIYETTLAIGDPLGATIDPPISLAGATGVRMRCRFENPGDTTIGYGATSADEMCVVLAYTSAPNGLGGAASGIDTRGTASDGTPLNTTNCFAVIQP